MTRAAVYCGAPSRGLLALSGALIRGASGYSNWTQLSGRTVVPSYQGRVAVHQLCRPWRLGPDDEVLVPAYNCGTEVDPIARSGAKIVPYRVDRTTRIDLADLRDRTTERTRLVYVTHYFCWPQPLRELVDWCRSRDLLLVEDCALALFAGSPDQPIGQLGDAASFSLPKFLPSPPGGLLLRRPNG